MDQNAGYFNKANQRYSSFLIQFQENCLKNSHVHEPSKLVENLQDLHITTKKNLTSNHCLKLKSLGFGVLKYIVLTFC